MFEFTDAELSRMMVAKKALMQETYIPRDKKGDDHCRDVYNTIVNPQFHDKIECDIANVGFKLCSSTEPGYEAVWLEDSDEESTHHTTLKKIESMIYCILYKKYVEERRSATKSTWTVVDVQWICDQLKAWNMTPSRPAVKEALFSAQDRNLVSVQANKMNFSNSTTVIILAPICFVFDFEDLEKTNTHLDKMRQNDEFLRRCAAERKYSEKIGESNEEEDE